MPNFTLSQQPKFAMVTVDTDVSLTKEKLSETLKGRDGVTLCIRTQNGHNERGGYFFNIQRNPDKTYNLLTIENSIADINIPEEKLLRFINHASGLAFDSEMLDYCQNCINFRSDEES